MENKNLCAFCNNQATHCQNKICNAKIIQKRLYLRLLLIEQGTKARAQSELNPTGTKGGREFFKDWDELEEKC